jgi:hypothetical protein
MVSRKFFNRLKLRDLDSDGPRSCGVARRRLILAPNTDKIYV